MKVAFTLIPLVLLVYSGYTTSTAFVFPAAATCTTVVSSRRSTNSLLLYAGVEPLASEGDWTAYLDEESTGCVYYFNSKTGQSLWEKPTASFPVVSLEGVLKLKAIEKQEAYLKILEEERASKKGFFQAILETPAEVLVEDEKPKQKSETREESDWFNSIFEQPGTTVEKPKYEKKKVEKEEKRDWFGAIFEQSSAAEEKSKVEEKAEKKEESDWFGSIVDSLSQEKPTQTPQASTAVNGQGAIRTAEPKKEETKIEIKEKLKEGGGIFGSMFNRVADAVPKAAVKETKRPAETTETVIAPIKIESAAYVLPHPSKVRWGGEDAVFVKGRTFGVFDGVSGAEKLDGVPLYSKTLANEMKKLVKEEEALSMPELTKRMLKCAEIADQIATGASTAVVASIGQDGFLRALSVGDSACMVIRNGKATAKTRDILHYFECPYQLSVDSPDRPRDGTKMNIELMRGDLILMASDGIFDNLTDEQIVEIAMKEKGLQTIAKRVSEVSRKVSLDRNAATPYAKEAQRYGDPDYADGLGGKVDDVSCIVVSYS